MNRILIGALILVVGVFAGEDLRKEYATRSQELDNGVQKGDATANWGHRLQTESPPGCGKTELGLSQIRSFL